MDPARYLERFDVNPATVGEPSLAELGRIQRAHVTSVPFENLGIVGHPREDRRGPGVTLEHTAIYEKLVRAERGAFAAHATACSTGSSTGSATRSTAWLGPSSRTASRSRRRTT